MALYHDLVHGIDNALMGHYSTVKRGDIFADFVAFLKLSLRDGSLDLSRSGSSRVMRIKNTYMTFCEKEHVPLGLAQDIWELYAEPWITRKLISEELLNINKSTRVYFEVSVANPRLSLEFDTGTRTYPLRGRVDEIDLTNKRIIERTIKAEGHERPPLLKDYQVWLLSRILRSLGSDQLPKGWDALDFSEFQLVVESPFDDFVIEDSPQYLKDTHMAYAWINDIALSESQNMFTEVHENARCVPANPEGACFHPFVNCWQRRYDLPRSRPEMRQTFHPWYRLLLWEQIWSGNLWQYQLLMLGNDDLLTMGIVLRTKVLAIDDDVFKIRVSRGAASPIRGLEHCTIIPFGTVYCGLRVKTTVKKAEDDTLDLQARNSLGRMQLPHVSDDALIISSEDSESPIMSEPPTFLQHRTQSSLFKLKGIGTDSPEKAKERSVIQILEAIFGTRPISREKK
jgi:hypothetical protein